MIDEFVRVVIDIGSSKVRVLIAYVGDEQPLEVLALGVSENEGMKRGVITDINATSRAITEAVAMAESQAGLKIHSASVSINGVHLLAVNSDAKQVVKKRKVSEQDISEVVVKARDIVRDERYHFVHVLPQMFLVDEHPGVVAPAGMAADMLGAHVHVVSARSRQVENVIQCIENANLEVRDLVFQGLAVSKVAATEEEQDLGVCVVDFGAGTMNYMVWMQHYPVHSGAIGLGGELVSSDLALVLKTPRPFAELLKCEYGAADMDLVKEDTLDIPSTGLRPSRTIESEQVVDIIVNRYTEMLEYLQKELHSAGLGAPLPAGFVFTGAAAQLPGLVEFAEAFLDAPVRIARPDIIAGMPDSLQHDPSLFAALGMVELQYKPMDDYALENDRKDGIIESFKHFLQRYI